MPTSRSEKRLHKTINSYVLAQGDQPYKRLKLLQKYLKAKKIGNVDLVNLKKIVDQHIQTMENREKKDKVEAVLFTKEGTPKKNKYGSAFCKRCYMYKDHEKECPYCGSLELTL